MLIIQVFLINFFLLIILVACGWLPSVILGRKTGQNTLGFHLFASVFLGFLMIQSLFAIWMTNGITMQWLNFLPILLLIIGEPGVKSEIKFKIPSIRTREILIPSGMLLLLLLYVVKSYAPDFHNLSRYPFIDLVSYAGTAYAMGLSGIESFLTDKALFYPKLCGLNLYHFTELWLVNLLSRITGQTELWITCFILPVFLNVMVAMGLNSIPLARKLSGWTVFVLTGSLCFAQGKLLLFNDYFLFHVLDLAGNKFSLIIPLFILLWHFRHNRSVYLTLLLFLPQINILLGVLLAILAFIGFFLKDVESSGPPSLRIWLAYFFYVLIFTGIFLIGYYPSPVNIRLSGMGEFWIAIRTSFQYGREAIFNLGFLYWGPFIFLAGIFRNRNYLLIFIPFVISKIIGKANSVFSLHLTEYVPGIELIICLAGLWWIFKKFLPNLAYGVFKLLVIIFLLCIVSATGNAFSGFMDFEQIYTLVSGSLFYILVFFSLIGNSNGPDRPLLPVKWKEYGLAFCLILLTWKTFRLHRSIPFDTEFYLSLLSDVKPDTRSIYFSTMSLSPFPLHVKAGFPLLFSYPDAHSIAIPRIEDSLRFSNYERMHITQFPFNIFCNMPENKEFSFSQNTIRFIKRFKIRFAWIDDSYPRNELEFLKPYIQYKKASRLERKELWKINPELIP